MQQALRLRLEARDVGRQLASIRGRLREGDTALAVAGQRTTERAGAAMRALTGRLESLSPLAVLARGYAVCWNADRTAIVREAASVAPGDRVQVTLARGEMTCEVTQTRTPSHEDGGRSTGTS